MNDLKGSQVKAEISMMEGTDSLPRKSGDLVFHDQWEKRAFAMAIALHESGYYQWEEFRSILISEINSSGETAANPKPEKPGYYEHWLSSLEKLLQRKEIL